MRGIRIQSVFVRALIQIISFVSVENQLQLHINFNHKIVAPCALLCAALNRNKTMDLFFTKETPNEKKETTTKEYLYEIKKYK